MPSNGVPSVFYYLRRDEMRRIGFIGLGTMGLPMAVNMARAGLELMVYNRTRSRVHPALEAGAVEADSPSAVFQWADTFVLMLSGPEAIDAVLMPVIKERPEMLKGKIVVNMGTNPPSFSRRLAARLDNVGAVFVDAPVSGTKVPAEQGALVIMASGPEEVIDQLSPIFKAVGDKVVRCGAVPQATMMKLAVNIVLSAAISGLVEGAHFAKRCGLDQGTFFQLILCGPMGNDLFAIKAKQIMEENFAPQASIETVREMLKHITDTAYDINAFIPNTRSNMNLIAAAMNLGLANEDACAIIKVFDK
jgi:3-hydroxyisobutyrate dehydrogenase-like beta-hydroxyacid dehydrogenase